MFKTIARKLRQHSRYSETVRELQRMSNRELSDLGIARSDIARVARQAAV